VPKEPSQEKLLLRLDQHSPLVQVGSHHPFNAPHCHARLHHLLRGFTLGSWPPEGSGLPGAGGRISCSGAIAGTANKACPSATLTRVFWELLLSSSRCVYSQTQADTVGLPGVASGNCAPCGIRSIGSPEAASILPVQLKNEMSAVAS
jgi:hypothetical protein